jgi:hypothetical protein
MPLVVVNSAKIPPILVSSSDRCVADDWLILSSLSFNMALSYNRGSKGWEYFGNSSMVVYSTRRLTEICRRHQPGSSAKGRQEWMVGIHLITGGVKAQTEVPKETSFRDSLGEILHCGYVSLIVCSVIVLPVCT